MAKKMTLKDKYQLLADALSAIAANSDDEWTLSAARSVLLLVENPPHDDECEWPHDPCSCSTGDRPVADSPEGQAEADEWISELRAADTV